MKKLLLVLLLPTLSHAIQGQIKIVTGEEAGALQVNGAEFRPGDGTASNILKLQPSSVTMLGPTITGSDLDTSSITMLGPTITALDVDVDSFTFQGNTFNGANQLLQANGSGLIANSDVDGSSVSKAGPLDNGSASLNIASVTVTTTTSVGPACASGFTRVGLSLCLDTDGTLTTIVSSAPTASGSAFVLTDIPILNSTNAKFLIMRARCTSTQDTADTSLLDLYVEGGGAGGSPAAGNVFVRLTNDLASGVQTNTVTDFVPLSSGTKDIEYSIQWSGTLASVSCLLQVSGYSE